MSREEQEANDLAQARELEMQIADVQRKLSDWRYEWRGKRPPLQAIAERETLEDELRDLRLQRQAQATPESVKAQLDNMWRLVRELDSRVRDLEKRLNDWFTQDARDRHMGWRVANAYRFGLAVLIIVDILVRVFR